ncbi:peroxidase family protein [Paraglaciecola aquimarina]|uniref:Peroxidase family protein n=1 Tax=Paraglaciecola aquimarina TaxID=1235557 RepID=A0ABU3SS08_9ALTE|nr:peroxidase family protein [Paraglaciecola aquimarina]MDU0352779.1 peroxidase family protein [Paraglaciecola aquimarina]
MGTLHSTQLIDALTGSSSASNIPAGLTYLGQLIAHDIVRPTNPSILDSELQSKFPTTPFLNLDSLYGNLNKSKPYFNLTEIKFTNNDEYKNGIIGYDFHRKLVTSGNNNLHRAMIPDRRNDDNSLVAQLAGLWQKFHNSILENGFAANFEEAKSITVCTFQLIVMEEFLRNIIEPKVYIAYTKKNVRFYPSQALDTIPTYFSHAVFRFGHSMVRKRYSIRNDTTSENKNISTFFRADTKLTPEFVIDWTVLFNVSPSQGVKASSIDTQIFNEMRKVQRINTKKDIDVIKKIWRLPIRKI